MPDQRSRRSLCSLSSSGLHLPSSGCQASCGASSQGRTRRSPGRATTASRCCSGRRPRRSPGRCRCCQSTPERHAPAPESLHRSAGRTWGGRPSLGRPCHPPDGVSEVGRWRSARGRRSGLSPVGFPIGASIRVPMASASPAAPCQPCIHNRVKRWRGSDDRSVSSARPSNCSCGRDRSLGAPPEHETAGPLHGPSCLTSGIPSFGP